MEPNHMTARKPNSLINHSILSDPIDSDLDLNTPDQGEKDKYSLSPPGDSASIPAPHEVTSVSFDSLNKMKKVGLHAVSEHVYYTLYI
jgi:hypothetical protein